MKIKRNSKALLLSLGLGAAMLCSPNVKAQGVFGNMLDNYYAEKEAQSSQGGGMMMKGGGDRTGESYSITNDDFGAPLGSGIAILLGAGLGYVAFKKKED